MTDLQSGTLVETEIEAVCAKHYQHPATGQLFSRWGKKEEVFTAV